MPAPSRLNNTIDFNVHGFPRESGLCQAAIGDQTGWVTWSSIGINNWDWMSRYFSTRLNNLQYAVPYAGAKVHLHDDAGLQLLVVEVAATFLILSVPSLVHGFVSGGSSGDQIAESIDR